MPDLKLVEDRSDCRMLVMLSNVNEQEVSDLTKAVADLLAKHGLAADESDPDSQVLSLIAIEPWEWPENSDALVAALQERGVSTFMIPIMNTDE